MAATGPLVCYHVDTESQHIPGKERVHLLLFNQPRNKEDVQSGKDWGRVRVTLRLAVYRQSIRLGDKSPETRPVFFLAEHFRA
jgi:hypothetical protein